MDLDTPRLVTYAAKEDKVENSNSSTGILGQALTVVQRPFMGPFLFGLLVGGVPFGIWLFHLGLVDSWGDQFFNRLTPIAVLIAALGATLTANVRPAHLLWRAFLTSISACIPVPIVIWLALALRSGFEILDFWNMPYAATLFTLWALVVTIFAWLVALGFTFLKSRYLSAS
jgi:hypothetical protein